MNDQNYILPASATSKSKAKLIIPVVIVIFVTFSLVYLMKVMKPEIDKKDDSVIVPLVEVKKIEPIDFTIPIKSEGMVLPKISINLSSEAMGRIVKVSESFTAGAEFKQGDVLLEIDPVDYELAITRAKANVAAQVANLDLQQAKSDLAKEDWDKYGKQGQPSALNLNLPQVDSAKAALAGARADLQLAQRNLEKTKVIAPFDGVVLSKKVDLGQYLNIAMPVATIAATEVAEIRVSLSDTQLHQSGLEQSKQVTVKITSDEIQGVVWTGEVTQVESQRDEKTLMNYAIVTINQPFTQASIPLRFNSYVELEFKGLTLKSVFPIERLFMMLNNKVKILDNQSKLRIREVDVVFSDKDYFYVKNGISSQDDLIITQLTNAKSGDLLKVNSQDNSTENK